jgi:hypothetical protein
MSPCEQVAAHACAASSVAFRVPQFSTELVPYASYSSLLLRAHVCAKRPLWQFTLVATSSGNKQKQTETSRRRAEAREEVHEQAHVHLDVDGTVCVGPAEVQGNEGALHGVLQVGRPEILLPVLVGLRR